MLIQPANSMFTRATRGPPLLPARILTEVEHRWDEAPPDDELSALEQLLKPLLGLLAQFSHVFSPELQRRSRFFQGHGERK